MPLHSKVRKVEDLLPTHFPDLFGPDVEHRCRYREHLFEFVAADLQKRSTESLAGELSKLIFPPHVSYHVCSFPVLQQSESRPDISVLGCNAGGRLTP